MDVLRWLFDAQLQVGNGFILWREVLGNVFGLLSALGGMRRKIWAWPVGILGNLILLTVFLGAVFDTPNPVNLLGQAGRQVMFIAVSVYGWVQWRRSRGNNQEAVTPRWATGKQRFLLIAALVFGTALLTPASAHWAPTNRSGLMPGSSWVHCWRPTAWPRAGSSSG